MDINHFINDNEIRDIVFSMKDYKPDICLVLLDSEFTRKNIQRRYSARFPFHSGSIEKKDYSVICLFDDSGEKKTTKDLLICYQKPMIIMGLGLYGTIFIKDIRIMEKVKTVQKEKIPIIIFGSPKNEKLENIKEYFQLYINNEEQDALYKLDWVINSIFSENQ